jgi:hypothetical protein
MEKSRIRDKHPRSATLQDLFLTFDLRGQAWSQYRSYSVVYRYRICFTVMLNQSSCVTNRCVPKNSYRDMLKFMLKISCNLDCSPLGGCSGTVVWFSSQKIRFFWGNVLFSFFFSYYISAPECVLSLLY